MAPKARPGPRACKLERLQPPLEETTIRVLTCCLLEYKFPTTNVNFLHFFTKIGCTLAQRIEHRCVSPCVCSVYRRVALIAQPCKAMPCFSLSYLGQNRMLGRYE